MLTLEIFDFSVHLAHYLIVFLTPRASVQRGLETESIKLFVLGKVPAKSRIMLVLSITQTDPPLLARRVDCFRPFGFKQFPKKRGLGFVGESNHDAAPLPQNIFVDK